jgi:predicted permease
VLRERNREFILGDLDEMHAHDVREGSRWRAERRYLRGLMGSIVAQRFERRWRPRGGPGRNGKGEGRRWRSRGERIRADLQYALRQLRRTPVMTVVASLSVAVAIAVAVGAFSMLNAVLFKPLALPASERVYHVYTSDARGRDHPFGSNSYPDYLDIASSGVFAGVTAAQWTRVAASLPDADPRVEYIEFITPNYFEVLGVPLLRGGGFSAGGHASELLVTEAWWTRTLNRDPSVLGRAVRVNGRLLTIAGVVPSQFRGTGFGPPVMGWAPIAQMPVVTGDTSTLGTRFWRRFKIVGRLAPGQAAAPASARLDALAGVLARQYPEEWTDMNREPRRLSLLNHRESLAPPGEREELVLAVGAGTALVFLVLLLACTNVAGLLLSRAIARQHELAVRLTLGATRQRLFGQLLVESTVLGLIGGGLGLLATQWAVQIAQRFAIVDTFDLRPDWRVLALALALSLGCAVVFGLAPALHGLRIDLRSGLASRSSGARQNRLRGGLIAAQVAVACVLILLAVQAARGVRSHVKRDAGLPSDALLIADLGVRGLARDTADTREFVRQVLERAAATPGVLGAATTVLVPAGNINTSLAIDRPDGERLNTQWNAVSADFFETAAIAPVAGRVFGERDAHTSKPIAVVSAEFARLWGAPILGRTIESRFLPQAEVVGVVPDIVYADQADQAEPVVYFLAEQLPSGLAPSLLVRTQPGAEAVVAASIQREIRARFSDVVVPVVETLRSRMARSAWPQQLAARIAFGVGAVELAMATAGLYGLLVFAVIARTRELGIRLALGARPGRASWAVVGGPLKYAAAGAAFGLVLGVPAAVLAGPAVLGERLQDPLAYLAALLCAVVAAALAALSPLRSAVRTQPAVALRHH